jgi:hypothetical protein
MACPVGADDRFLVLFARTGLIGKDSNGSIPAV